MLHKYTEFLNENFHDDFESKYSKLFNDSDEEILNKIRSLFQKIENETDNLKILSVYDSFLKDNQNYLNNKIVESENEETINNILRDNLMSIYFTLKNVQIKLDDKELFEEIFEKSNKNLKGLMTLKKDDFSTTISTYIKNYMIPQIEKMSGVEEKPQEADEQGVQVQTAQPVQPTEQGQSQEEPKNDKLETYKTNSEKWFSYIYDAVWYKLKKVKTEMNSNRTETSNIDQLSNLMKNSANEEAKKQLLTKITTLSKEDLNKLGDFLNINKEEVGDF
jgi:hypothetical protein